MDYQGSAVYEMPAIIGTRPEWSGYFSCMKVMIGSILSSAALNLEISRPPWRGVYGNLLLSTRKCLLFEVTSNDWHFTSCTRAYSYGLSPKINALCEMKLQI
jgi:hypothetical protein